MSDAKNHYPAVLAISVREDNSLHRGSGTLLAGSNAILTAAHLFPADTLLTDITVRNPATGAPIQIKAIHLHPQWQPDTFNNDLAILELQSPLDSLTGLELYRGQPALGHTFVRVGYGDGAQAPQHIGTNTFDAPAEILNPLYQRSIADGSQLLYDYDSGLTEHNILNALSDYSSSAVPTEDETLARAGDSGGPALINNQIAGVASYVVSDPAYDSDLQSPSSFGEAGADTDINHYLDWIDTVTETQAPAAPQTAAQVDTTCREPASGSLINYFLLHRSHALQTEVVLWYETLDSASSATAEVDYMPVSGWVSLAAGQRSAAIPVRIFADNETEPDETVVLQVSDPGHTILAEGITLIATHLIIDNNSIIS